MVHFHIGCQGNSWSPTSDVSFQDRDVDLHHPAAGSCRMAPGRWHAGENGSTVPAAMVREQEET